MSWEGRQGRRRLRTPYNNFIEPRHPAGGLTDCQEPKAPTREQPARGSQPELVPTIETRHAVRSASLSVRDFGKRNQNLGVIAYACPSTGEVEAEGSFVSARPASVSQYLVLQ